MIGISARDWAARAVNAAQAGDRAGALAVLAEALTFHPADPGLWHYSGSLRLQLGDAAGAAEKFAKARALLPGNFDYAVDQAIALSADNRHREALEVLEAVEAAGAPFAHYCSTRANAERGAGNAAAAADWYDRALRIEPRRPKALHGRASVALERGEADALARFDAALQVDRGNPYLWLGKAQALDVAGEVEGARQIAQQLAEQAPQFTDALFFLAQLRKAQGEADFASHYAEAARRAPQDPAIPQAHARTLAGMDLHAEAATVMAQARRTFPAIAAFALAEAVHAGAAGDHARAEAIFAGLNEQSAERKVQEAQHRIRRGEYDRAEVLLAEAEPLLPTDISAWSLRGVLWRLTGDPREDWLHRQAGLHDLLPLRDADRVLATAIARLHELHDSSPMPLGQSLRGGSQTRGQLFDRREPEFAALHAAIRATLEDYRAALPAPDPAHPLLRHRGANWRISGSWSVRLAGGGDFHIPHVHPQGIVSSALYCLLPPGVTGNPADREGWLELGRPPPDLCVDLPPLRVIEPREGHLALFPSTLYHGTRPFGAGQRMTVAFDVTLADKRPE
ncbi:MAG: tetratricopeptide repeat protein [Erythrobacter sp.]|nr:tetratricopeptide repeat protein [Erythrobacter sp.]